MITRDFRIGWRLLFQEKAYSAVVVLGLAIGIAVCFLLLGLVHHSFSYNSHIPENDKVFIVKQRWNTAGNNGHWGDSLSLPARDAIVGSGVPLLASTFISRDVDVRIGANVQTIKISVVDPAFRQIFQPEVLSGDLATALARPDTLALTRETAIKLFGAADATGKTLHIAGKPYLVSAVLADPPSATTLPYTALAGISTAIWDAEYRQLVTTNWGSSHGPTFVKINDRTQLPAVGEAIRRAMIDSPFYKRFSPDQVASLNGRDMLNFEFGPITDAYLDPTIDARDKTHGDRKTVLGLAAVAILILLLAATNYVNLATVRTLRRQREIAVRKVLGASAGTVSRQFLVESIVVCLVATVLGVFIAWLVLPVFTDLVQRELDQLFTPVPVLLAVVTGVMLGLAAGSYPTWSALKVRPTAALSGRGNAETVGGLWLRRVLTVMQFATAMGLTGLTLAVAWQTHYASTLHPGFDPEPLLIVRAPDDMRNANVRAFRDALARIENTRGVAVTDAPVTINFNSTSVRREGGSATEMNYLLVSPEFFDVYGIKPLVGRLYSPSHDKLEDEGKLVLNEAGILKLGFASAQDAAGKYVRFPFDESKPNQIVGVAPDIRHRSARDPMQPTMYFLSDRTGVFTVRTNGDTVAVQRQIEQLWERFFPNAVPDIKRMSLLFGANYEDDLRLAKLLAASSVIAIAIAAFGIYVLAAYSVQRKSREIVLRKLYGASGTAIGKLVVREFAALIGIGAAIGLPVAYLATERYLAAFSERAPVGLWTVGFALAVAALVALCSTLRHTFTAMRLAPVLALRD
ncbi:ABC transporter permease [Pseudoduganella sp. GCM10020061]|uniref:ABC transporter permease n=1 Tax=Pseudoduganella sp. GCM10020061 TaxID=3317345 RepID=UPI00363E78F9